MRILLSICTILASAPMAEAQLGSVSGTVQQTTDLEREALQLDSTSRIGSRLQTGQPTSRLELMRQQQAVRDARRAAVAARDVNTAVAPQAGTTAVTETALQVEDTARAAAQTRSTLSVTPERVGAGGAASGQADAVEIIDARTSGAASAIIEPATLPVETPHSRILTEAEIATRSAQTTVTAIVPPAASVQVQTPEAIVVSQGRSRTYTGPVTRADTVVIRDRRVVYEDRNPGVASPPAAAAQPRARPEARVPETMWISRDSISDHAFPLSCALLLILSLLLALRLLATPRRRRA